MSWKQTFVRSAVEIEFSADEAQRQLDTAIDWIRYAEVLAYDDAAGRSIG